MLWAGLRVAMWITPCVWCKFCHGLLEQSLIKDSKGAFFAHFLLLPRARCPASLPSLERSAASDPSQRMRRNMSNLQCDRLSCRMPRSPEAGIEKKRLNLKCKSEGSHVGAEGGFRGTEEGGTCGPLKKYPFVILALLPCFIAIFPQVEANPCHEDNLGRNVQNLCTCRKGRRGGQKRRARNTCLPPKSHTIPTGKPDVHSICIRYMCLTPFSIICRVTDANTHAQVSLG